MAPLPQLIHDTIHRLAREAGAAACGVTTVHEVDDQGRYERWIASGSHGTMDYCARHADVRSNPELLLEGARTVIVCAFNYNNETPEMSMCSRISRYAWGNDYHYVVRQRLGRIASGLTDRYGGRWRVLADTAPMRERYWAVQSGVGFIGLNNLLIVPSVGSWVFLGEVLWTGEAAPDAPCTDTCLQCGACVSACPGGALDGQGGCDARHCLSYLTIEHRGDLPPGIALGTTVYGCDRCQQVCPHNASAPVTDIGEFAPDPAILTLTETEIMSMTPSHWRRLTRHSAMSRVPLAQLQRNLQNKK